MSICPAVLDRVDADGTLHIVVHPQYLKDLLGAMEHMTAYINPAVRGYLPMWKCALHEHPAAVVVDVPTDSLVDAMNAEDAR